MPSVDQSSTVVFVRLEGETIVLAGRDEVGGEETNILRSFLAVKTAQTPYTGFTAVAATVEHSCAASYDGGGVAVIGAPLSPV